MTISQTNAAAAAADGSVDPVHSLLTAHPRARLLALNEMGMCVPIPVAVPITAQQHTVDGLSTALEIVVSEDIQAVVEAWQHVRQYGQSQVDVRPSAAADTAMTMHFVDSWDEYGVFLCLITGEGAEHLSGERIEADVLRPRLMVSRQTEFGLITEVDDAMEAILGHTDAVGRTSTEFVHPEDSARVIGAWMEMLARPGCNRRLRFRERHLDGHWVWFEVTLRNLLHDPDERCVVVEAIDISDEMAAHEYVVEQETLLRRLTESLPVGVVQVDAQGQIVHRNSRADLLFGQPDARTIQDLLVDVVEADARKIDDATRAALADVDSDIEISVVHPGGDVRRCQVTLRALADVSGSGSGFLLCITDVTEPARLRDQLHHRATYDPLTDCHNRASVLHELDRALTDAAEGGFGVSVVFIDLDGFKNVNDRRGHAAGDALLRDIGNCLRAAVRAGDVVGRVGGDEFIIVQSDTDSPEQALELAQRVSASLAAAFTPEPPYGAIASIGVAWVAGDQAGPSGSYALISGADAAMYHSKARGDGQAVLFAGDMATAGAPGSARLHSRIGDQRPL